MAHQDRRDDPQPVHTFCNRVVKHGGAPGQPLLDHAPAVAQQVLQHHRVALIVAVAPVAGRVIAVGVGITVAKHAAAGHVFISHKSGSLKNEKLFLSFHYIGKTPSLQVTIFQFLRPIFVHLCKK